MDEMESGFIHQDSNYSRDRREGDDYRRNRDRHHGRHRRRRSRDRRSSERRHSRRRSRSRSRSRSSSRHRHRGRDLPECDRDKSPFRRSSDFDQGDYSRRHYETDDRGNWDSQGAGRSRSKDESIHDDGGGGGGDGKTYEKDWRVRLTSIRDAHFNRSKQPPLAAQNQFQNDGSFLEMFKKKMAAESTDDSSLTPNSLVLASSSIPYNSDISLPPLTAPADPKPLPSSSTDQDLDGVPMKKSTLPVPVSVGRRRCAKPLKTGVVFKKQEQTDEDEGSQEKLDAWSRYLQEVQKYKQDNLVEDDNSRPLVK